MSLEATLMAWTPFTRLQPQCLSSWHEYLYTTGRSRLPTRSFGSRFVWDSKGSAGLKRQIYGSIRLLCDWLEKNDYRGYDPFDGLNARVLRPLTFNNELLRTVLQQGVRRFPVNLRPLLGIARSRSTKGMGFLARGFLRLHEATGDAAWRDKAESALQWLVENQSKGYSGACWGNHFDYQSRSAYVTKDVPSVVWTSLIGHAFLDAHEHFQEERFLQVAASSCDHILRDLGTTAQGQSLCIGYF